MHWDELIDEFLHLKGDVPSSETYIAYRRTALKFVEHLQELHGDIRIEDVSAEDVSSFVLANVHARKSKIIATRSLADRDSNARTRPAPSTVNNRISILSGLFDVAIYHNPAITNHPKNLRAILGRKLREAGRQNDMGMSYRAKALNRQELLTFYRALDEISFSTPALKKSDPRYQRILAHRDAVIHRNQSIFHLFEATGLRVSGMCGLNIHDINLDLMEVRVIEKGEKMRMVPILPSSISDDDMQRMLIAWIETYRPLLLQNNNHGSLWVNNRGKPIKPWFIQDVCRKAMRAAQLDKPYFGPHLLRHTFATDKLDDGNSPRDVARALGHSGLQTINTYDSGQIRDICERMKSHSWNRKD